jgi:multisubunit Na+/H+ antiporter MnhG subunit
MEPLIPWMWGVNGLGSVLGSTLTIAVAIRFGFTEAMISGAALYLVVFVLFRNPASAGLPAE